MTTSLMPEARQRYYNNDGTVAAGCYLYTYAAGTTTPKATWTDSAGTIAHTNPIVLDAKGEAVIFWDGAYKVDLKTAAGTQVTGYPVDNYVSFPTNNEAQGFTNYANTITVLKETTAGLFDGKVTQVLGYHAVGDGGGGTFRWNASSTVADDGGMTIQITSVATGRWERISYGQYFAKWFGAIGDGVADDTGAIQAGINSLSGKGGELTFPIGTYKITAGLLSRSGVLLKGVISTDLSNNTNGSGASSTRIVWGAGSNAGYMYEIAPSVIGNVIWGGGSVNISWDGGSAINGAVHLNNTKYALFDGKIRNVTYAGVLVSSINGSTTNFSQQNEIRSLEFVYGTSAATENANACVFQGNNNNIPGTQQRVGQIAGLVKNGFMLVISETDNCNIDFIGAAVDGAGTGGAVKLNNVGFGPSNSNTFNKVHGKVDHANGLYGNTFHHYGSEGGGYVGGGTWDGEIEDYVSGRKFKSHVYQMRKWLNFKPGDFMGDAATSTIAASLQYNTLSFPNTGTPVAAAFLAADYDLADGSIDTLDFFYSTNDSTGGNLRVEFRMSTLAIGGSLATPEHAYAVTIPQAGQYVVAKFSYAVVAALSFSRGDTIALSIRRLSADALDTATGEVQLLGVRLNYKSTGPNSPGSGTYIVPAWD